MAESFRTGSVRDAARRVRVRAMDSLDPVRIDWSTFATFAAISGVDPPKPRPVRRGVGWERRIGEGWHVRVEGWRYLPRPYVRHDRFGGGGFVAAGFGAPHSDPLFELSYEWSPRARRDGSAPRCCP